MKTIVTIEGMSCDHCAQTVKSEMENLAGVTNVKVDIKKGIAVVKTEGVLVEKAFKGAVERAGFTFVGAEAKKGLF